HGQGKVAVQGNVVGVIEYDQFAQLVVAGKGGRLDGNALHQIPVTANDIGVVVDDVEAVPVVDFGQMGFGHGHAHRHGQPLSEGAGGGIHAAGVAEFRVARRLAA